MEKMNILIILFILLTGCSSPSSPPEESSPFSVSVSAPEQVSVDKDFAITAQLTHSGEPEKSYVLEGRKNIFYFLIKNSEGNLVNSLAIHDMGLVRTVSGNILVEEDYIYKFKEPGTYTISAVAEFSWIQGDKKNSYALETELKTVTVASSSE